MKRAYVGFYLDGRDAKLLRNDLDPAELAEAVLKGEGSPHEVVHKAVADAAKALEFGKHKKQWLNDSEEEIRIAGGDKEEAFKTYLAGRIDEAVSQLEHETIDELTQLVNEGDEEDDDDDDDDEKDGKPEE